MDSVQIRKLSIDHLRIYFCFCLLNGQNINSVSCFNWCCAMLKKMQSFLLQIECVPTRSVCAFRTMQYTLMMPNKI